MDDTQIEKRLNKLDQQRQKQGEDILRLAERLEAYEKTLNAQSSQGKELVAGMTRIETLDQRLDDLDEVLTKQRDDILRRLHEVGKEAESREKKREKERQGELDELADRISELQSGVDAFREAREAIERRQAEEIRITKDLDALKTRFDGLDLKLETNGLTLVTLQEAQKGLDRRTVDLTSQKSDLATRLESNRGLLEALDDRLRRFETRVAELTTLELNRKQGQDVWIEKQEVQRVEFERTWKEKEKTVDEMIRRSAEIDERLAGYGESVRKVKQLGEDLEKMLEKLERRIHEITEMFRLAEDQLNQEWTTYQADDQKRWNTYKLTIDEHWREHFRLHDRLGAEVASIEETAERVSHAFGEIQQSNRSNMHELIQLLKDWSTEVAPKTK